jgi:hypothetical protein
VADPLQDLLAAGAIPSTAFPPTSRYAETKVTAHDPGDGSPPTPHLERRFCPQPDRFTTLHTHRISEGDRRDNLAAGNIGESELWWRIADANEVLDPRSLTDTVGKQIRITLAEGITGGAGD